MGVIGERQWILGISCLAGLVAVAAPAAPTGRPVVDALLLWAAVALVGIAAAWAPWWAVAAVAGVSAAIASDLLLVAVGCVALRRRAVGAGDGRRVGAPTVVLAASAGVACNVLARSELVGPHGLSAAIALGAGVMLFVAGARRWSTGTRRIALLAAGCLAALAIIAIAGFGFAAARARSDLAAGVRWAESGVSSLEHGDFASAADDFASASTALERAHDELTAPWALGSAAIPIVAQHRDAAVDMSDAGASGAGIVAAALEEIDLESLRIVGGQVDLEALAALRGPLGRVHVALDELASAVQRSRSPWLVHRAEVELDDFETSIAEHLPSLDDAITALDLAPRMLGADAARHYLVLYTSPSTTTALGGAIVGHAELSAEGGQLAASEFGSSDDAARLFGDLPLTPDFPDVAAAVAARYTERTDRVVDGVIVLDPFVLARLMTYTGPIASDAFGRPLTVDDAPTVLLRELAPTEGGSIPAPRGEAVNELARRTVEAVLAGVLPEPTVLAADLGPLADERRLTMWSADAVEQDLLSRVGMSGELPSPDGGDGWSLVVADRGDGDIDGYLERRASYESAVDLDSGDTAATVARRVVQHDAAGHRRRGHEPAGRVVLQPAVAVRDDGRRRGRHGGDERAGGVERVLGRGRHPTGGDGRPGTAAEWPPRTARGPRRHVDPAARQPAGAPGMTSPSRRYTTTVTMGRPVA